MSRIRAPHAKAFLSGSTVNTEEPWFHFRAAFALGDQIGFAERLVDNMAASGRTTFDLAASRTNALVLSPGVTASQSLFPHTVDDIPDNISSTRTISVDGAHIVSTIDAPGDQDFFRVELQAGTTYEIG